MVVPSDMVSRDDDFSRGLLSRHFFDCKISHQKGDKIMEKSIVLIHSGGLDSTVLLYDLIKHGYAVKCLSFNYGQRHSKELKAAQHICEFNGIDHDLVDLSSITKLIDNSSQTGNIEVPHGHYADENMKLTVVPNRNMIMLSIAVGHAINLGFKNVAYGAHSGDHDIYPDCRAAFIQAIRKAIRICDWHVVDIVTPYYNMDKGKVVERGIELGVPFEKTWTCYEGKDVPCGKCGSCVERNEAFASNNMIDPLIEKGWSNEF